MLVLAALLLMVWSAAAWPAEIHGELVLESAVRLSGTHDPDYGNLGRLSSLKGRGRLEGRFSPSERTHLQAGGRAYYDLAYEVNDANATTRDVVNSYRDFWELQDAFVSHRLSDSLLVVIGRQTINWGMLDQLRVVDFVSPEDNRQPGLVDLIDRRLSVTATRGKWSTGEWTFEGIAVHEVRMNENPPFGSEFYPASVPPPPRRSSDGQQLAVRALRTLNAWELALHAGSGFDREAHIELDPSGSPERRHARLNRVGLATSHVSGPWMVKLELGAVEGIEITGGETSLRTDVGLGVEYGGIPNTHIALEMVNRHLHSGSSLSSALPGRQRRNTMEAAVHYIASFWRERVELSVLGLTTMVTDDRRYLARIEASYALTDYLELEVGVLMFDDDAAARSSYDGNDRLFARLRMTF